MQHKVRPIPSLLVTGSNGQVGFEFQRNPTPSSDVIALDRATCDLTRPDMLHKVVREYRPDVIVNPAAHTTVGKAETDAQTAFAVNSTATGVLAEETRALGSLLVHCSADYVLDGTKNGAYVETDPVNPQSVYGKDKFAGEEAIAQSGATVLVIRTYWVAGAHGDNFAKTMLKLGRERDSPRVIADQFGAPTMTVLTTDATAQIVARAWPAGDRAAFPSDVYHLATAGETVWHGYVTAVPRYAKVLGAELEVDLDRIEAAPATAHLLLASRPANSRMNTGKLVEVFGVHLPDW